MAATTSTAAASTIRLYRGFRATNEYTWSPFVNKLEARLRFDQVPYEKDVGAPVSAPRGKIPYLSFQTSEGGGEGGDLTTTEMLSDTTLIIDRFIEEGRLSDWNANLSAEVKAQDMALRALLEDKFYFYSVHERWIDNYHTMRDGVLSAIPYPVRLVVGLLAYRKISATLYGQGTSRYTADELRRFKVGVWRTVDAALAVTMKQKATSVNDKDAVIWAMGGDHPTEVDATLFAFVTSSLQCIAAPETQQLVKSCPTVMDYASRIHRKYFPDYDCDGLA